MQIYMGMVNPSHAGTGSGTDSITVSPGGSAQSVTFTWSGGNTSNTQALNNVSFTVGSSATSQTLYCYIDGESTGSTTIYFDQAVSAPTGLGANNIARGTESFTANVYITSWGVGSGSRYRELQCWTYDASSFVQPRRYQPVYGDELSGNITVNNSSSYSSDYGPLTIVGNTKYVLGVYATNGAAATSSQRVGAYTTLAYAPEVTVNTTTTTSASFSYSTRADGGQYSKTCAYSIDGGTSWVTFATVASGAATSGTFNITGLTPGTGYSLKIKVTTAAGTTTGNDVPFATVSPASQSKAKFYGPVNGEAKQAIDLYGSHNEQAVVMSKIYGPVNNQAKLIHQGFGHIYGELTYYTDSSLTTTNTIPLTSQLEVDQLAPGYRGTDWSTTIKGITVQCDRIASVVLTNRVRHIGEYFLLRCRNMTSVDIGNTQITTIPTGFVYYGGSQSVSLPNTLTTIGASFLYNCSSFNSPLTLGDSITTIGGSFLSGCASFNQDLTLPSSLTSLGRYFLFGMRDMKSTVNVGSLDASIATTNNQTLSATSTSSAAYNPGIKIAGTNRAAWMTRFPNRTSSPYRKLIDAGY
jgi:hypothetical protein